MSPVKVVFIDERVFVSRENIEIIIETYLELKKTIKIYCKNFCNKKVKENERVIFVLINRNFYMN